MNRKWISLNKILSPKSKAILAMLISAFSFSIMGIAVKLATDVPLSKIDVATATTIQKLSQFWVLIFAAIFLNEKIRSKQYLYLLIALVGVIIVSKPTTTGLLWPTLVCFSSSLFAGIAFTFLSKLKTYEEPSTIVFFFSFFSTVVMFIPMLLSFEMVTFHEFILLLLMGLGALGGQVFMTISYHDADASDVSIYAYANVFFSAILSLMIWGTLPDLWSMMGIVIIIGVSYLNFKDVQKYEKS